MKIVASIRGIGPGLLQHNVDGAFIDSRELRELKDLMGRGPKQRNEPSVVERRRELEWLLGLYVDPATKLPTLPVKCVQAAIHRAAVLTRDGQRVNRALQVMKVDFHYTPDGASVSKLWRGQKHYLEAVVSVQRQKILRIRPLFPEWRADIRMSINPQMGDIDNVSRWLESAGEYIGLCDWRRDNGGPYGCFEVADCREA